MTRGIALAVGLCVAPGLARAESYALQIGIADGASDAVIATGIVAEQQGLMGAGFLGTLVAAPIIHVVHERYGIAAASLGLRVAAWTLGSIWLYVESVAHGQRRFQILPVLVMFGSIVAVQVADALLLADTG